MSSTVIYVCIVCAATVLIVGAAFAFRKLRRRLFGIHLDPNVMQKLAVFSALSRLQGTSLSARDLDTLLRSVIARSWTGRITCEHVRTALRRRMKKIGDSCERARWLAVVESAFGHQSRTSAAG